MTCLIIGLGLDLVNTLECLSEKHHHEAKLNIGQMGYIHGSQFLTCLIRLVKTTKETVSEYVQSLFGDISSAGTLIMSFKLTVGRTSILDISAYHNEAVISIYPFVEGLSDNKKLSVLYLANYIQSWRF